MKQVEYNDYSWRYFIVTVVVVAGVWLIYAIVRYMVAKGTGFDHFPLFIMNKVFSSTAAVLIGLSFITDVLPRMIKPWKASAFPLRKYYGLGGYAAASVHAIIGAFVMRPDYFEEFHETTSNKLNIYGEAAMLFGISAFVLFGIVSIASIPSVSSSLSAKQRKSVGTLSFAGLMILFAHICTLGIRQWLDPTIWPSGIMPISMAVFSVLYLILVVRGIGDFYWNKK